MTQWIYFLNNYGFSNDTEGYRLTLVDYVNFYIPSFILFFSFFDLIYKKNTYLCGCAPIFVTT